MVQQSAIVSCRKPSGRGTQRLKLITIDQVCELFNCTREFLRRQVDKGEFPKPCRLSRKMVRFRLDEVERYLESRRAS